MDYEVFQRGLQAGASFVEWERFDQVPKAIQNMYPMAKDTKVRDFQNFDFCLIILDNAWHCVAWSSCGLSGLSGPRKQNTKLVG